MRRIAIVSPAGVVDHGYVHAAMRRMQSWGMEPVLMPHAIGHETGRYAAPLEQRLADLMAALTDDSFDAILCTRGGYGCVQLLPHIDPQTVASHPKPIIGFSDVTALHALWHLAGVPSIHGPMVKHIARWDEWHHPGAVTAPPRAENRHGMAKGILTGGNWAVIAGLVGTRYDMLGVEPGSILFLEDIGERIYRVDRMLHQLKLSGVLDRIGGLVFGAFTDYGADVEFTEMEQMLSLRLSELMQREIPVAFGMPIGHIDGNAPVVVSGHYELRVDAAGATLLPVSAVIAAM